jgi:hypothetical protein
MEYHVPSLMVRVPLEEALGPVVGLSSPLHPVITENSMNVASKMQSNFFFIEINSSLFRFLS